jgi:hypothetical protein
MFAAMMLFSLNAALYGGEAGTVIWDEISPDGGFVSRRRKTGVSRIAVLWPETRQAINELRRERETVFNTVRRSYTGQSCWKRFGQWRDAAEVDSCITFSNIRDAAYTTALSVSFEEAELLAGHRLPGTADNYLRRNPQLVAKACTAIADAFNVADGVKGIGPRTKRRRRGRA